MLKITSIKNFVKINTGVTQPEDTFAELQMAIIFAVANISDKTNLPYEDLIRILCNHLSDPKKIKLAKKRLLEK